MRVDAVVCAYNEEATVGDVVRTLRAAGVLDRVLVMDDGSRDATAARARDAGAEVVTIAPNGGKGPAMLRGWQASTADAVFFCDADLVALTPFHVRTLVGLARDADMVVGLRDYGPLYNFVQRDLPAITGERVVRRAVLEAVEPSFWRGYRIEVGINAAAARLGARVVKRVLAGLGSRAKWTKGDVKGGIVQAARMTVEVLAALRDAQGERR